MPENVTLDKAVCDAVAAAERFTYAQVAVLKLDVQTLYLELFLPIVLKSHKRESEQTEYHRYADRQLLPDRHIFNALVR